MYGSRERLFDQEVQAGVERLGGDRDVPVGGHGDHGRVVRFGERGIDVGERALDNVALANLVAEFWVQLADRDVGPARLEKAPRMSFADRTDADDKDAAQVTFFSIQFLPYS
jgi:hypothetical protein